MIANYADIWEAIADSIGDEDAVVQGPTRRTWAEYERRAACLAAAFHDAGLRVGAKVGLYLFNSPEYLETSFAAYKQRLVPVNINYRYVDDELSYLIENSDSEAVVFHASLGARIERVRSRAPRVKLWIEVADCESELSDATRYGGLASSGSPAPRQRRSEDDLIMIYTGGTTGLPKGVMIRLADAVPAGPLLLGRLLDIPPHTPADIPGLARRLARDRRRVRSVAAPPLMHGTGIGIGSNVAMTFGGCTLLLTSRSFDARELWDLVETERATVVAIVGDSFATPMVRALADDTELRPPDLAHLRVIASSGAMLSRQVKDGLVHRFPQVAILDLMASTEGGMATSIHRLGDPVETARFVPVPNARVFDDNDKPVAPGSGVVGRLAVSGAIPVGYYKDPVLSERTFRVIDDVRFAFPGDAATVGSDGTITVLGRGSLVVNTGGEKVFVEEVEQTIKLHPAVDDCLVFGQADDAFGQRVVAVVSLSSRCDAAALIADTKQRIARYKAPREIVFVSVVPRLPNGKPDYPEALRLFEAAGPTAQSDPLRRGDDDDGTLLASDDLAAFRGEIRRWLERNGAFDDEVRAAMSDSEADERWGDLLRTERLLCPTWPTEHGGRGLSEGQSIVLADELDRAGVARHGDFFGDTLVGPTLLDWGTKEQRDHFLPKIFRGEVRWCQGFSEPDAGSDLAAVRMRAELRNGEWVISGQKVWTTGAHEADYCFTLCRTSTEGSKHGGISFIIVPMHQAGVTVRPIRQMEGSSEFNELFFDRARAPQGWVVGGVGNGWRVAMSILRRERGPSANTSHRRFADHLADVNEIARATGKQESPVVRQALAHAWTGVKLIEWCNRRIVESIVNGTEAAHAVEATAKLQWSQHHQRTMELAIDLLGAAGLVLDGDGLERYIPGIGYHRPDVGYVPRPVQASFMFSRADTIWGGTSEIQRTMIAERVLGMPILTR